MTHNEALHEGTRNEIYLGFANQLHSMSLSAKEMTQLRTNQKGINGLIEVPEEFGAPDKGKPLIIPIVYNLVLADQVLTFVQKFVESYGLETEYKDRTQMGLYNDAMKQCKARYHNESPKIPDLMQGHILKVIRPESKTNQNEMSCFISLKADKQEVHINFIASDKGRNGLKFEDRIT